MITRLEEINPIRLNQINNSMFFRKTARPRTRQRVFERFRFSDPLKWITQNRFDEIERSEDNLSIRCYPVSEVFNELRLKNRDSFAFSFSQDSALYEAEKVCVVSLYRSWPLSRPPINAWRFAEIAEGEPSPEYCSVHLQILVLHPPHPSAE